MKNENVMKRILDRKANPITEKSFKKGSVKFGISAKFIEELDTTIYGVYRFVLEGFDENGEPMYKSDPVPLVASENIVEVAFYLGKANENLKKKEELES